MKVDVVTEIVVNRRCSDVAEFAADPSNATLWYSNIKAVEWKTERRVAIGSKIAFVAKFAGREIRYTYEISEMSPGETLTMRTPDGPFPMETRYVWKSVGEERTQMFLQNRGEPRRFSVLVAPFITMMMRRENRKDLKRLKMLLEGQVQSSPK
jgi:hypothetical protein